MSTAFEMDASRSESPFSSLVPGIEGVYDLTPDQVLLDQEQHESEVRS